MLVFLHGFLGQKEDWDPLFSHLDLSYPKKAIDLPGHGTVPFSEDIALAVKQSVPQAKVLIGYSAGGRIALELKNRFPEDYERVIVLSTHPGLASEEEKEKRWEIDKEWIKDLRTKPYGEFLQNWYGQELFAHLRKSPHYSSMLERRKTQNPVQLAAFLEKNSIAKKPVPEILPNTFFICGKEDLKYEKLYRTLNQIYKIYTIENTSHAAHLEHPQALAKVIKEIIHERDIPHRNET